MLPLLALAWMVSAAHATKPVQAENTLLAQDLTAVFAARTARVAPYAAWTYGWIESYANSYRGAYRVILHLWSGPDGTRGDVFGVLRSLQQEVLRERVSRPDADADQIAQLLDRQAEARLYVLSAQAVSVACPDRGPKTCVTRILPQLQANAASILATRHNPIKRAEESRQLKDMLDFKQTGDVDLLHMARPLTTRLLIIVLRFTELAWIVLLVTGTLRRIYVPDIAITQFAVGLAVSWSLDYGLLRLERAVNADAFRSGIETRLMEQEPAIRKYVNTQMQNYEMNFVTAAGAISGGRG